MRLGELSESRVLAELGRGALMLEIGPFVYRVRTTVRRLGCRLHALYADFPVLPAESFADFHVGVDAPNALRRWYHANVEFRLDDQVPFKPLPRGQSLALFESGLNWCVAQFAHTHLVVHAAVLERRGGALLMPAPPGSGKSTLCAALVNRGWRLLSDEMALVRLADGEVAPCPRPVSLKNESIAVMRGFAPEATILHTADGTIKGTVAHMKPPRDSVERARERAAPAWIVFPRYEAGAPTTLTPHPRGAAFMTLAINSFNYNILGTRGFEALSAVIDRCRCLDFRYSDLDEAIRSFDGIAAG